MPHPFQHCDYQYVGKTEQGLRFHIKYTHEWFIFCDKCEYTAKRNSTLDKHALTKHECVRYSCDYCTHKSTDKEALKQHIKSQQEFKVYGMNGFIKIISVTNVNIQLKGSKH